MYLHKHKNKVEYRNDILLIIDVSVPVAILCFVGLVGLAVISLLCSMLRSSPCLGASWPCQTLASLHRFESSDSLIACKKAILYMTGKTIEGTSKVPPLKTLRTQTPVERLGRKKLGCHVQLLSSFWYTLCKRISVCMCMCRCRCLCLCQCHCICKDMYLHTYIYI